MSYCYIIHSDSVNSFYIGATNGEVEQRVLKHNSGHYGSKSFTSKASDWKMFLELKAVDYPHAIRMEKHIKKMKSKVFIQNLKKYPELRKKLFQRTTYT